MEIKMVNQVSFLVLIQEKGQADRQNLGNPLLSVPTPGALPLGGSHNLALEILQGNDESLDVGDFMGAERPVAEVLDVNSVMEKSRRI